MDKIINTIAEELNIKPNQVESTVKLNDEIFQAVAIA